MKRSISALFMRKFIEIDMRCQTIGLLLILILLPVQMQMTQTSSSFGIGSNVQQSSFSEQEVAFTRELNFNMTSIVNSTNNLQELYFLRASNHLRVLEIIETNITHKYSSNLNGSYSLLHNNRTNTFDPSSAQNLNLSKTTDTYANFLQPLNIGISNQTYTISFNFSKIDFEYTVHHFALLMIRFTFQLQNLEYTIACVVNATASAQELFTTSEDPEIEKFLFLNSSSLVLSIPEIESLINKQIHAIKGYEIIAYNSNGLDIQTEIEEISISYQQSIGSLISPIGFTDVNNSWIYSLQPDIEFHFQFDSSYYGLFELRIKEFQVFSKNVTFLSSKEITTFQTNITFSVATNSTNMLLLPNELYDFNLTINQVLVKTLELPISDDSSPLLLSGNTQHLRLPSFPDFIQGSNYTINNSIGLERLFPLNPSKISLVPDLHSIHVSIPTSLERGEYNFVGITTDLQIYSFQILIEQENMKEFLLPNQVTVDPTKIIYLEYQLVSLNGTQLNNKELSITSSIDLTYNSSHLWFPGSDISHGDQLNISFHLSGYYQLSKSIHIYLTDPELKYDVVITNNSNIDLLEIHIFNFEYYCVPILVSIDELSIKNITITRNVIQIPFYLVTNTSMVISLYFGNYLEVSNLSYVVGYLTDLDQLSENSGSNSTMLLSIFLTLSSLISTSFLTRFFYSKYKQRINSFEF